MPVKKSHFLKCNENIYFVSNDWYADYAVTKEGVKIKRDYIDQNKRRFYEWLAAKVGEAFGIKEAQEKSNFLKRALTAQAKNQAKENKKLSTNSSGEEN